MDIKQCEIRASIIQKAPTEKPDFENKALSFRERLMQKSDIAKEFL